MNELNNKITQALNTSVELLQKRLGNIARGEVVLSDESTEIREILYSLCSAQNHLDQLARS